MRRRILVVVLSAVVLAIALFGIPLGVAVQRTITGSEQDELERLALRGAVTVGPGFRHDPVELPPTQAADVLGVYGVDGALVTGDGPSTVEIGSEGAPLTHVVTEQTQSEISVFVPVSSGERVIAVVRAASPVSAVRDRVWKAWAGLLGLAVLAAGSSGALAAVQSRRLSRPLVALQRAATDLGDGNFAVSTERSGVPEIDRASESLDRTATRLADMMARERNFSTHASHQLRTPLTTLRLQLETGIQAGPEALARAAVDAISSADQLERTIDDVLALARGTDSRGMRLIVDDIFDDVRQRWHGPLAAADRPLRFVVDDAVTSHASRAAARQILDVLVDNALQHGAGAVTLRARESSGALAIDVSDEGAPPDDLTDIVSGRAPRDPSRVAGSRLGLPLARSMAEAEGGRLVVGGDGSHTQLTLLLPSHETDVPRVPAAMSTPTDPPTTSL